MYLLKKTYKEIFNDDLSYLFKIFLKEGDEARLVGGCVRNYILNIDIEDYDIATVYTPDQIEEILKNNNINYFSIGKEFGTITAIISNKKYEITTLRKDIKTDGRHTTVEFTNSYKEDALRRDFTFNALYIDFNGNLYDYFNGLNDLLENNIKFIGNSEDRIIEDNLRILRFFRFYGSYCFNFEYENLISCIKHKDKIRNLSIERISSEFYKILNSKYCVKTLKFMQQNSILQEILNIEINFSNLETFYSIKNYLNFEFDHIFLLALIFSKNKINYNLMLSKKEKFCIETILYNIPKNINKFEIKKLLFILKNKILVKSVIIIYFCNNFTKFSNLEKYLKILEKMDIPQLDVTGNDLIENGFENKNNYSIIINKSKDIFIKSKFKYKKNKIIKLLKKEFLKNKI